MKLKSKEKQKFKKNMKNLLIIISKNIFIGLLVFIIYFNFWNYGKPMNAEEITSIGLNTFFIYTEDGRLNAVVEKVITNSVFIIFIYFISIIKMKNYYDGLKYVIRIKSKNLLDFIKKTIKYIYPYILLEIILMGVSVFISMNIIGIEGIYKLETFKNLILMMLFYTILPIFIIFIISRIEMYIIFLLLFSSFAPFFIYKIPIYIIPLLYVIIVSVVYIIILIKEKYK